MTNKEKNLEKEKMIEHIVVKANHEMNEESIDSLREVLQSLDYLQVKRCKKILTKRSIPQLLEMFGNKIGEH